MSEVEDRIGALARAVADKALEESTPLPDMVDALKAATGYLQTILKLKRVPEEANGNPTFDDFSATMEEAQNAPVRGGAGRRARGARQ